MINAREKTSLLSIKGLEAWYDPNRPVLTDFSAGLGTGEIIGLIGLNGTGKTTFLKVLSGLLPGCRYKQLCYLGRPAKLRDEDFKVCRYTVFD